MAVEVVAWESWYTNNPDEPGFTVYHSGKDERQGWIDLPADGHEGTILYVSKDGGPITRQMLDGHNYIYRWEGPDGIVYGLSNDREKDILQRYPGAILKRGRDINLEMLRLIDDDMMAAKEPCFDCLGK